MTTLTDPRQDTDGDLGRGEARLIELLLVSEPVAISPANKRRSLRVILARQGAVRHRSWVLRPVLAIGFLIIATAAAAGSLGGRWLSSRPADVVTMPRLGAPPRRSIEVRPVPHAPAPLVSVASVESPPPRGRSTTRATPRLRTRRGEDPGPVVNAIKALRQDHDPATAQNLLADYLRTYPDGALSEEALALSIEAAVAAGSPSAVMFSERYLKKHPTGRFRRFAEQHLARQP
jgi:hypothetical protein